MIEIVITTVGRDGQCLTERATPHSKLWSFTGHTLIWNNDKREIPEGGRIEIAPYLTPEERWYGWFWVAPVAIAIGVAITSTFINYLPPTGWRAAVCGVTVFVAEYCLLSPVVKTIYSMHRWVTKKEKLKR